MLSTGVLALMALMLSTAEPWQPYAHGYISERILVADTTTAWLTAENDNGIRLKGNVHISASSTMVMVVS